MPESEGSEKTERATERRRKEAREKGQVAKSTEVNTLLMFGAAMIALNMFALNMLAHYQDLLRYTLSNCASFEVSTTSIGNLGLFYFCFIKG